MSNFYKVNEEFQGVNEISEEVMILFVNSSYSSINLMKHPFRNACQSIKDTYMKLIKIIK